MGEEERMYGLLARGERQEEMMFGVDQEDPDMPLVQKMVVLGLLENEAVMFTGWVVKLTATGLRALVQARSRNQKTIDWSQDHRPVQFQQTVHGTANTQVGDHNTMRVQVTAMPIDAVLDRLTELRSLVAELSHEDRAEALGTIESAEKAVKKGLMDRFKTYGPTLVTLGTGTVEFAEKVKVLFGL